MSTFHPAVYSALYLALHDQEQSKAGFEAVADMYDVSPMVARCDEAIAGLKEAIDLLHSGDADAAIDDRLIAEDDDLGPMHCMLHNTPAIPPGEDCPECKADFAAADEALAQDEDQPTTSARGHGQDDARIAAFADARRMLDFLEANPALPIRCYDLNVSAHTAGTDDERLAAVDQAAALLGVDAGHRGEAGYHYQANKKFGRVTYTVVAVTSESMKHYNAARSLGEAALERAAAVDAGRTSVAARLLEADDPDDDDALAELLDLDDDAPVTHAPKTDGPGPFDPRCNADEDDPVYSNRPTCPTCRSLLRAERRGATTPPTGERP